VQIVTDKGEEATTAVSEHWGSVHVLNVDEEVKGEALAEVYCWPRWERDELGDGRTQAWLRGVHGVVSSGLEDGSLVEGADALEEAVAGDHMAPELARGRGAEEADGRADTQEDQLEDFIGEVVDAGPCAPAAATIPSHGWRLLAKTFGRRSRFGVPFTYVRANL